MTLDALSNLDWLLTIGLGVIVMGTLFLLIYTISVWVIIGVCAVLVAPFHYWLSWVSWEFYETATHIGVVVGVIVGIHQVITQRLWNE